MKIAYAICSLFVLTVVGLVFLGSGTSFAGHDCPCSTQDLCGWHGLPTITDASDAAGNFNTATDGDDNEPTIDWCLEDHPIGGIVQFVSAESVNINAASVTYTPSSFQAHCSGTQEIGIRGKLATPENDGTIVTRALIGVGPACDKKKSIAVNAF